MPAERIYNNRPVFRLRLPATPRLDRILSWTPRPIQSLLQHIFPEWFLPPIIILKEKTTEGAAYFDNELQIYRRLQPLQGDCIPRLLGVAITNDWIPTLVLEYIDGTPLNKLEPGDASVDTDDRTNTAAPQESPDNYAVIRPDLRQGLKRTFDLFRERGVAHGDPELHNFILVGGRDKAVDLVKAVDLELAHDLGDGIDDNDETTEEDIVMANILSQILHC